MLDKKKYIMDLINEKQEQAYAIALEIGKLDRQLRQQARQEAEDKGWGIGRTFVWKGEGVGYKRTSATWVVVDAEYDTFFDEVPCKVIARMLNKNGKFNNRVTAWNTSVFVDKPEKVLEACNQDEAIICTEDLTLYRNKYQERGST